MKIAVKGIGITKFGELWDKSLEDLMFEAANKAIKDSGFKIKDIDGILVGNMLYGKLSGQNHLGALLTSKLGLDCYASTTEGACASGGLAIHLATQMISSGEYQNILVVGVEKMTDQQASDVSLALMGAGSEQEREAGLTFPGLYALMTQAHFEKFGTTKEHLAKVAEKNHYHGSLNENAQYPFTISVEKVLKSTPIAHPLNLLDCSPLTDGAAAVVLSKDFKKGDIFISASTVATDNINLADRESLTEIKATKIASQKAYRQAGIKPSDISLAEVHDCFTIAEILAMEDLGFCKKGDGGKFIESGVTRLAGKMPVNTSGGLKACGHPVGATGVKQIVELTLQLRGKADKRQVKNAKIGLAQNVGGTGATVVVNILQK